MKLIHVDERLLDETQHVFSYLENNVNLCSSICWKRHDKVMILPSAQVIQAHGSEMRTISWCIFKSLSPIYRMGRTRVFGLIICWERGQGFEQKAVALNIYRASETLAVMVVWLHAIDYQLSLRFCANNSLLLLHSYSESISVSSFIFICFSQLFD